MRLIDNFMPLIGYVVQLRDHATSGGPGYQQVRGEIQRLLTRSEACVKNGEATAVEYDLARFIVCAWTDEVLLGSQWKEKGQWQREQLQRLYYSTVDAGVEAFDRLNQLGLEQKDVREVYYVCLSLGFRGRFSNPGDDLLLDQLRLSNLKLLGGGPAGRSAGGELFPEAYPLRSMEAPVQAKGFSMLHAAALGGPLLLFAVLHLVFRFTLHSVAEKLF